MCESTVAGASNILSTEDKYCYSQHIKWKKTLI